tara:strand:- start:334 stop:1161 length:828 start_codon:yes stop_codon:yes gene_type:complete
MTKHFYPYSSIDVSNVSFALGTDRNGKTTVSMIYQPAGSEVALVTCPALSLWPRCSGDGNFGTMWGPTDITKAKYTLDLTDNAINDQPNTEFEEFRATLERIDDALLDFVTENQLKILGRKNLGRDEVKMLQIRSIRPKYDKVSGVLNGHTINLSTAKYAWDGMGGKYARKITICDHKGQAIPNGTVSPGDVVAATIYANQVYTGVGGDKFGIHWSFQDVSVVCQRGSLEQKSEVPAFTSVDWAIGKPYVDQVSELTNSTYNATAQFGPEATTVT